jgi:hypothetical protein
MLTGGLNTSAADLRRDFEDVLHKNSLDVKRRLANLERSVEAGGERSVAMQATIGSANAIVANMRSMGLHKTADSLANFVFETTARIDEKLRAPKVVHKPVARQPVTPLSPWSFFTG